MHTACHMQQPHRHSSPTMGCSMLSAGALLCETTTRSTCLCLCLTWRRTKEQTGPSLKSPSSASLASMRLTPRATLCGESTMPVPGYESEVSLRFETFMFTPLALIRQPSFNCQYGKTKQHPERINTTLWRIFSIPCMDFVFFMRAR